MAPVSDSSRKKRRREALLTLASVVTLLHLAALASEAQQPKRQPSVISPKQYIFPAGKGSPFVKQDTVEAGMTALEDIEQVGRNGLLEVPGLTVHLHAVIDRAREGGNGGDVTLTYALIDLYAAKQDNVKLARRVKDFDPVEAIIAQRERACDDAIRDMFSRRVASPKVPACEEANVDPPVGDWPIETIDPSWIDKSPAQGSNVGAGCASALRYLMQNVSLVTLSEAGILGEAVAKQRLSEAPMFCTGTGEVIATDALKRLHHLHLVTVGARLAALQQYMARRIPLNSRGDYDAWVRQSWIESERAAPVKRAYDIEQKCYVDIDAALKSGVATGLTGSCQVY